MMISSKTPIPEMTSSSSFSLALIYTCTVVTPGGGILATKNDMRLACEFRCDHGILANKWVDMRDLA